MKVNQHQLTKRPQNSTCREFLNKIKSHSHKVSLIQSEEPLKEIEKPLKIYYQDGFGFNKFRIPLSPSRQKNNAKFFLRSSLSNNHGSLLQKKLQKSPMKDKINEKQDFYHEKSKQKKFDLKLYKDIKFGQMIKNKNKYKTPLKPFNLFNKQNIVTQSSHHKQQKFKESTLKIEDQCKKSKCPSFLSKSSRSKKQNNNLLNQKLIEKQKLKLSENENNDHTPTPVHEGQGQVKNMITAQCQKMKYILNKMKDSKKTFNFEKEDNFAKHTTSLQVFKKFNFQPYKKQRQLTFPQGNFANNKKTHISLRESSIKQVQQLNFKQQQTSRLYKQPVQKIIHFEDNQHNHQPLKNNHLEVTKIQDDVQKNLPFQKKKQSVFTVQDIKQALIDCDLFSSDDCENLLKNHHKDIYKKSQKVKFQDQNLIFVQKDDDDQIINSSQTSPSNQNLKQKLSQKKSKWLLLSADIIKQSLKELSQYNTQRQIQNREKRQNVTIKRILQNKLQNITITQCRRQSAFLGFTKVNSNYLIQSVPDLRQVSIQDFQLKEVQANHWRQYRLYLAQHKATNSIFSIRQYSKNALSSNLSNFIQQIKIQMFLDHPNIEKVYTVFSDKDNIYSVHQFTNQKLSDLIKKRQNQRKYNQNENQNEKIIQVQAQLQINDIISAVEEVHLNSMVHKLIRPQSFCSIFKCCKLSQFINSSIFSLQKQKQNDPKALQFQQYMCPQLLFDNSKTSMDIWSLGILVFEILTGRTPFNKNQSSNNSHQTTKQILSGQIKIPQEIKEISQDFMRLCLKRNPKERGSIFDLKRTRLIKQLKNKDKIYLQISVWAELQKQFQYLFA